MVCGDFNVNSLPESDDVKKMILKANIENQAFIDESELEYEKMIESLENG